MDLAVGDVTLDVAFKCLGNLLLNPVVFLGEVCNSLKNNIDKLNVVRGREEGGERIGFFG